MKREIPILFSMSGVYSGSNPATQERYEGTSTDVTTRESYPPDAFTTFEDTSSSHAGSPPDPNYVGSDIAREEQQGVPRGQGGTYSGDYTGGSGTDPNIGGYPDYRDEDGNPVS